LFLLKAMFINCLLLIINYNKLIFKHKKLMEANKQEPADYVDYDVGPFDLPEANPEADNVSKLDA